jgi:hypothetical protein
MRSAFHIPKVREALTQRQHAHMLGGRRPGHEHTDARDLLRRLRRGDERRGEEAARD